MTNKYGSRKFGLAVFSSLAGTLALFTGFLDGMLWMQSQAAILALYGAADVTDKKLNGK